MKTSQAKNTPTPPPVSLDGKKRTLMFPFVKDIVPSKTNPRKRFTEKPDWPEFVKSVKDHGVAEPILVRPAPAGFPDGVKFEIVAGERRWKASQEAQTGTIPVVVQDLTDGEAVEIQQLENLQREDLDPLEEAQGYADWKDQLLKGGTCLNVEEAVDHICARVHRKRTVVYGRLALLKTSPAVQEALRSGRVDLSRCELISQIAEPEPQELALAKANEKRWNDEPALSVREFEKWIAEELQVPLKGAAFDTTLAYQGEWKSSVCRLLKGDVGPCTTCPFRTGNMVEQYPALKTRPNVCTRPSCYKAKTAAAAQLQVEAAEKNGKTVLTQSEFNKRKSEFVRGAGGDHNVSGGYGEDWEDVMGKHKPTPTLVATPGGLVKVYKKTEAVAAVKKNRRQFYNNQAGRQSQEDRAKEAKRREETEERRKKLVLTLMPRLVGLITKMSSDAAWKLSETILNQKHYRLDNSLLKQLTKKTPQIVVVASLMGLDNDNGPVDYYGNWEKEALAAWKLAGVDLTAEEQKALATEKAKAAEVTKASTQEKGDAATNAPESKIKAKARRK